MTEIEKLRKELNDRLDAFENKPKCEIGNWHWTEPGSLYFIEKINGNICFGYGLSYNNNWSIGFVCYIENIKRLATEFEVDEMLKKEAIKRGLVEGAKIDLSVIDSSYSKSVVLFLCKNYVVEKTGFSLSGWWIMLNGIWATVIKEKTIKEWGEEFLEFYKVSKNFLINDDFCEFITKHNFKLPT